MAFNQTDVGSQEGDAVHLQNYLTRCLIIPRFLGVFPFRISGGIIVNRIELVVSVVVSLLSIGVIMVAITIDVRDHSTKAEFQAAMISFVEGVLVTVSICLSTMTMMLQTKNLKSLYNCLVQVGLLGEKIPGKRLSLPSSSRVYVKLLFTVPLIIIISMETLRAIRNLEHRPPIFYLSIYAHCMCNIKLFGVAIEFAVFTEFLGHWFKNLHKAMAAPDQYLTCKTVQLAGEACDCLVSAVEYVRLAFGPTLLVMVVNCFVKSTANFNKLIREDQIYWITLFNLWILNVLMQLLLVVIAANYTINQANLFEWTMYRRIKNESTTSIVSTQTKMMLFLVRKKKIKVDLCGFTTLDNGLLGKILAATLTYSIVLSQLNFTVKPNAGLPGASLNDNNCTS